MRDGLHHLEAWRNPPYDAVIVGGGPAGLSAALVLGRANARVLVVDDDRPANAVSEGVGGLPGHGRGNPPRGGAAACPGPAGSSPRSCAATGGGSSRSTRTSRSAPAPSSTPSR